MEKAGEPSPSLAVVLGPQGSKLQLAVGATAKPLTVPARDVWVIQSLTSGEPPPSRLSASPWCLNEADLTRALPKRRDLAAAWVLLSEPGSDPVTLADWCELVYGGTATHQLAAGWLWLQGGQSWFRVRQGQIVARPLEDLRRLRRDRWRRRLQQERRNRWHGLLRARRPVEVASLSAEQQADLAVLHGWASGRTDVPIAPELLQGLQAARCAAESGSIRHLLVDLGQWHPHHLPSLERSSWELGFPADLEAEAERLLQEHEREQPGDAGRADLCAQRCFTIDDDDTRDVDDALALEANAEGALRLWIHIADPGRLVAEGSPLDQEARRRGTSLYLARGTLPMFPSSLSHGPFSLRAGQRCPAWSLWIDLDEHGGVAASGVSRSWVRPTYRLSYSDADELIELAPPQEADLASMHALLARRRQWRVNQGALLLDQAEGRIRDAAGVPRLEISEPGQARLMVAEAMILAGAVVGDLGSRHGLALPYRSQPPATLPAPAELEALQPGPVRHAAIRRCLSRGHTGTQPSPHFSLGLPAYVQATSPIRRYADLVVQRQLLALQEGGPALQADQLQNLLEDLESPLRQAVQISREDQRHWQQVWFAAHRGQAWRGVFLRWLRPQDRLGLVHVEDLAMDFAAECPAGSDPADALILRVQEVDPLRDQLRLIASA
ncbi:MAG: RNB domain-containing ribonuclease [Cyanobium sp.]|nr:RNB domain-containing ribonuclease [Cyanobium sp.]